MNDLVEAAKYYRELRKEIINEITEIGNLDTDHIKIIWTKILSSENFGTAYRGKYSFNGKEHEIIVEGNDIRELVTITSNRHNDNFNNDHDDRKDEIINKIKNQIVEEFTEVALDELNKIAYQDEFKFKQKQSYE